MDAMKKIALLIPELPSAQELKPFLDRIDAEHWYSNYGPLVRELEAEMLLRLNNDGGPGLHLTSVSNCTAGLELALLAHGLKPGSRVLVPALTFVASATAVLRAGLEPVLCDVDPANWLLTPEIALSAVREVPVDAVMPVSTYGCPHDPGRWAEWSKATGLPVIVDAAGAFGNQNPGPGATYVYSLHATKVFSSGEGGLVVSGDAGVIRNVRRLTNFGIDLATGLVDMAGTNAKMSEYHAAVGLAMLPLWDRHSDSRRRLHRAYLNRLSKMKGLTLQDRPEQGVYSIMPAILPASLTAEEVGRRLAAEGIETRRWYCPILSNHPAFASAKVAGNLDCAVRIGERLLALPFHTRMTPDLVDRVCGGLESILVGAEQ